MNSKKILWIVLIIVVLAAAAGLIYQLTKDSDSSNQNTNNAANTNTGEQSISEIPVKSTEPVFIYGTDPVTGVADGGEEVLVVGDNFIKGATVRFGDTQAPNVTFVSETELRATTPSGEAGTVDVTVSNPDGLSGVLQGGFTYE